MNQLQIRIPIAEAVSLVPTDFACAATGYHIDLVMQSIEDGSWPFVFDIGAGFKREVRELRIWRGCLLDPERAADLHKSPTGLIEVIGDVIGTETGDVRGASLERRWTVSNQTFRRLLIQAEIRGRINKHTMWFSRPSLAAFLERRRVL